jgi:CHAT domain-containing protein
VSGVKRLCSSVLAVSIGLIAIAPPILQPIQAQTQNSQQQELEKLLEQALKQKNQGKATEAIATFQQALTLSRQLQDKKVEAITLVGIGFNYDRIGQPQKALEFYNSALPISREVGDRSVEAITQSNIGSVYLGIGQPQKALEFYNSALPISREVGNRLVETATLNGIGLVYDRIGQPQKALEFYNSALPISREVGDRLVETATLNNIGLVYDRIGQPQKALEFYNSALPILREVGDRSGEATTLNNIGLVYFGIGQPQKALEFFNQSLPISREVGNRSVEATTLSNIGGVYDNIGQPQKALEFYNQSLPISREVGNRSGEATILSNIGLFYRNNNQPTEAVKNLEQSVEITLQLRAGLERSNRQQFLESNQYTSISLIDLLIAQKQSERAYQWVNLTTTADLADYSRLIDAKVANPQAQRAIESWNQSNRQLESLRQELQQKFSPQLSVQINTLQAQVNQQAETISRQFPEVAELFETKLTDITRLQANIPTGTVVIQPVLLTGVNKVPDTIALFVLTKDKLTVTQEKIDPKTFDELVTQYRGEITDGRFNKYRATSSKLYDILIRPVEAQITANKAKQVSIIATGKLRYIPFETLIDSKTNKYLIEKYPVNNLTRLSGRPLPQNKLKSTLLGLGNPFPKDDRSLQGAEDEIKSITPLLPGSESFLGTQAKLDTFTTLAPRFPILHLATHGCFNPEGCPSLKLEANTILFSDRNFNIADAALLGLKNTDLVVLSACQTAVSANSNGEEFAGMAYLFERAGARSVIASLWLAKDEETKQLMVTFYKNLNKGMTKGEALRSAKLSLIDKHPLYWSPFILIGDAR